MIEGVTPGAGLPSKPAPDSPEKIADAARQFEGLMVAELLKSARESSQGSFYGTDEDNNSVSAAEFAEQAMAQSLSASGGLGLSKLLIQGLKRSSEGPQTSQLRPDSE